MSNGLPIAPGERGAALLTVLLIVAVTGALAVAALEKLQLSTALAVNTVALDQARAFAIGAEALIALRVDDLMASDAERTTLAGGRNGEARRIPLPGGGDVQATLRDGGNCFNINSVVDGSSVTTLVPRLSGITQFAALLSLLGMDERSARRIAESAGDWADNDNNANPDGAEDGVYADMEQPYRAGNTLFADVSELRAVNGVTPELYERMRPWLCALPVAELSPINVNSLSIEQAPLLVMLAPEQLSLDAARHVIATRPVKGWADLNEFSKAPGMEIVIPGSALELQPQLKTSWFTLELKVEVGGAELVETALIDARQSPARIVARQWGSVD